MTAPPASPDAYWAEAPEPLLQRLRSRPEGLTSAEAAARLVEHGPNALDGPPRHAGLRAVGRQLKNPLLALLVVAAVVSALSGEWVDAAIVLTILVASVAIGASREHRARVAVEALRARIRARATALRDGARVLVPAAELVPGDVMLLAAGNLVPADARLLDATDLYVNEAVLTGESFPVRKSPGASPAGAGLAQRTSAVFQGTNVRSGGARAVVVRTGRATELGGIARRLTLRRPETEFERGVRRFGSLLTAAMLLIVLAVFAAHVLSGRAPVDTLLFSIALAVGLSPELLPAILGVNLARGAEAMAQVGVVVRNLDAIENLGSMDILCTDKTGTLTEGVVRLEGARDAESEPSGAVLELAAINAALETGLANPLDDAVLDAHKPDLSRLTKVAEVPFDFIRKRVSVVVDGPDGRRLITKGAFHKVLEVCAGLDAVTRARLASRFDAWSEQGARLVAVAHRTLGKKEVPDRKAERDLTFAGFLTFQDRPKPGVERAIRDLGSRGVRVKLITGDAKAVARCVAGQVGLSAERVLTGGQLDELHDEALWQAAEKTDLFVEVDPNQKERIILSLKKMGHVVGFLGDGVNDAPAMYAADTSLSVEGAVDVARDAADFVLLDRDLQVIRRGIDEGRRTFANTLKYVLTTTSANLGNMLSMAAASLFLPFLPLLPGQILLNNFLSDIPAVGMAGDEVDRELVDHPRRWDMRLIARFMVDLGALSSAFDGLTFAALLLIFHATPEQFRTGWFVESLLSELVIALVVRTRRPWFRSRPGRVLLWITLVMVPLSLALPFLPFARALGFVPIPATMALALVGIVALYVLAADIVKQLGFGRDPAPGPRAVG